QHERAVRGLPRHLRDARLQAQTVRSDDDPLEGPVVAGERAVGLGLEHVGRVVARVVPADGDAHEVARVVRTAAGPVEHPGVLGRGVRDARTVRLALFVEGRVAGEDVLTGL